MQDHDQIRANVLSAAKVGWNGAIQRAGDVLRAHARTGEYSTSEKATLRQAASLVEGLEKR